MTGPKNKRPMKEENSFSRPPGTRFSRPAGGGTSGIEAVRWIIRAMLVGLVLVLLGSWWATAWMTPRAPLPPSGGLWWPVRQVLEVPAFYQADARWAGDALGATPGTLGREGCAVASAAMVLTYHGAETDPGHLNRFLQKTPGGYTPEGWIYWEKAAEVAPGLTEELLPHYEDDPSYALLDLNLLRGNPTIVRLRYPSGVTHFVVVAGKDGFDYLVQDPGERGRGGLYPLREFGSPIEALRFYQPPVRRP